MQFEEHLAAIEREAGAMSELAHTATLTDTVPTCPKWTIEDLLDHAGAAVRFAYGNLTQPPDGAPNVDTGGRAGIALTDWIDTGTRALVDRLRELGPSAPCWTLDDQHVSAFWARRDAQELAIHLWDGQNAAGAPQPIDAELAVDGIDEYLGLVPFFRRYAGTSEPAGDGETIHFHATDASGEWLVRLGDDVEITREHAKGDVAARGPASDLYLVVTRRKDPSAVELFGDESLVTRWQELARF